MTSHTRWLEEISSNDKSWAGDKAIALSELFRAGFRVPRTFCVSASAYRDTFAANGLNEKIIAHLSQIEIGDPAQLEQVALEIRDEILRALVPIEIENEIHAALTALNSPLVAIRVSRVVSDVPNPTASGLPQAHLAIPSANALESIRQAWTTPWNSRAIYFRHRKKISPNQVVIAVIAQTMLRADAAGVLFTASPLGRNPDEIHIDAIWGLGEPVIAARWKPDHFIVDKKTGALREKNIAEKTVMQVAAVEGGVQTVGVPSQDQGASCLTDAQVLALAEMGMKIEKQFGSAQDIEWCRVGEEIFLLQSRAMN